MDQTIPRAAAYFIAAVCGGLGVLMFFWRAAPNMWIGVRLPWTFADRKIWDKSWRLAAMFLTGMGVGALFSFKIFIISVIHLVILGILYPVFLYWRKYNTLRYWKDVGWKDYHPVARCRNCGHWQKLQDAGDLAVAHCDRCQRPFQEG
jgi:hypothetical protein